MEPLATLNFKGQEIDLWPLFYGNGRPAIFAKSKYGEPIGKLTVNIPEVALKDAEICVKTWSDGEELSEACRQLDIFEDTGRRVPTGWVEAEIWKVKK